MMVPQDQRDDLFFVPVCVCYGFFFYILRSLSQKHHYTYDAMMDLLEKPELNEERLEFKPEDDDEKKAKVKKEVKEAVKAAFGENLIDVNSAQHADAVMANLKEKILGRYFAVASADTVAQKV